MNPVFRPLRELADAVRERRVSPVALAETFLERLEQLGPRYNAVVTVTRERAMTEARRAEARSPPAAGAGRCTAFRTAPRTFSRRAAAFPPRGAPRRYASRRFDFDATVIRARSGRRRARGEARDGRAGRRHGLSPAERVVHRPRASRRGTRTLERRLLERLGLGGRRPGSSRSRSDRRPGARSSRPPATAASPACDRRTAG